MMEVIQRYSDLPVVWGETDCCQFAGECVEALTGRNPTKHVKYHSQAAAERLFRTHGGLEGVVTVILGKPVETHSDGYIGLVDNGVSQSLGVFLKDRIICRVENSVVDLPAARAKVIWNPWLNYS